jgi:hypothetical protein
LPSEDDPSGWGLSLKGREAGQQVSELLRPVHIIQEMERRVWRIAWPNSCPTIGSQEKTLAPVIPLALPGQVRFFDTGVRASGQEETVWLGVGQR